MAAGLGLCGASAAFGQGQGMGHWLSEVTTQDGDAIVEPGETATVSLWMDMEPSVGEELPDGSILLGFGAGFFDIIGGANADKGTVLGWEINEIFKFYVGDSGTTDGVSIFDVAAGQLIFGPFDDDDPIFLMSFEWQPSEYSTFDASYQPFVDLNDDGPGFYVWKSPGAPDPNWLADDVDITISVAPSPPGLSAIASIGSVVFGAGRRRSP